MDVSGLVTLNSYHHFFQTFHHFFLYSSTTKLHVILVHNCPPLTVTLGTQQRSIATACTRGLRSQTSRMWYITVLITWVQSDLAPATQPPHQIKKKSRKYGSQTALSSHNTSERVLHNLWKIMQQSWAQVECTCVNCGDMVIQPSTLIREPLDLDLYDTW